MILKAIIILSLIPGIPVIALITLGVGQFEANALQFGLDQLARGSYTKTDCLQSTGTTGLTM